MRNTHDFSIDTLRRADGTYRDASAAMILGALRCGHTAHLQTDRGIIAIRPYTLPGSAFEGERGALRRRHWPADGVGKNWLVEFYPRGSRDGMTEYRGQDESAALQFAFEALNGWPHTYRAGDTCEWFANQGPREATVLAVLGGQVLIEYLMPGTTSGRETSALVVCRGTARGLDHLRNVTHRRLPARWARAMRQQGTRDWHGVGQREAEPVPFPAA